MDYSNQFGLSLTGGDRTDEINDEITTIKLEINSIVLSLSDESETRDEADIEINNRINAEILSRQQGDETLQTNINTETSQRTTADETLQTNINTETTQRTTADETLQTNINTETTQRTNEDIFLNGRITTETEQRTTGDATLQTNINTETEQRIYADLAIDFRLDNIEAEIDAIDLLITGGQHIIDINDDITELKANTSNAFLRFTEGDDNLLIGTIENGIETNQIRYNTDVGAFTLIQPNSSIVLNDTTNTNSRWQITTTAGKTIFNYIASSGVVDTIFTINANGNIEVDNVITTQGNLNNILSNNLSSISGLQSAVSTLQQLQQDLQDELNSFDGEDSDGNPILGIVGTIFGVGNTLSIVAIATQVAFNTTAISALTTAVGVLQGSNLASTVSNLSDTVANVSDLATETSSLISRVGEAGDCVLGEGTGSTASAYNFRLIDSDITNVGNMFFKNTIVGKIQNLTTINDVLLLDVSGVEIPQSLTIACETTFGNELFYKTETLDTRFTNKISNDSTIEAIQSSLDTKVTITEVTNAITGLIDDSPSALDTLRELATALNNNPDFANEVLELIGTNTNGLVTTNEAVALNTAKTGITPGQASSVALNTAKVGITPAQASAIEANSLKTGITPGQASAITANTEKIGLSIAQMGAIAGIASGLSLKLDKSGGTMSGNLTIQSAESTLNVFSTDDSKNTILNVCGNGQGTGIVYVGQSLSYGGGLEYNGDNTPVTSGSGADFTTLFRRDNGVNSWTARNAYNNNNWEFRGALTVTNPQEITYKNQTLDTRFLRLTGGTLTGALTVTNPQEITYKNQTLDTRFVSQTAYDANNTEINDAFGELSGLILNVSDAGIAGDNLKLNLTGGTLTGSLTAISFNTANNTNGFNVNSPSNGNSHIGPQYPSNYLSNTAGTIFRTFVSNVYTTTAEFFSSVIIFNVTNTFNLIPTGTILTTVCDVNSVSGYLLCNGAIHSNSAYPKLRAILGTSYGGSTTLFNVPNYSGSFLRGFGSISLGGVSYASNVSTSGNRQQIDQNMTPNTPSVTNRGYRTCGTSGTSRQVISRAGIGSDPLDTNTGIAVNVSFPRQGTENRPYNHAVKYWIRY